MLQICDISKRYITGDLVQTALDRVSLNLRDNEFVAVLGPSGSGKTTLLNVIGGLDRYDSGDLIINGTSTRQYSDRDWDSYRNHTVGFVFQSYNLIPHQSILSNVELALTISGISKAERRRRAREALERVGLGDQAHKRPNQMSGGQMQRVAIARALVNNPDILLADEPTGALDTETSLQVMDLLKEVASDRLVVMVTHNPDLAERYATRIVRLQDGRVTDDSDPLTIDADAAEPPVHRNMGKSSMSVGTAVSLSFNNLRTKLARTLLTAFAGSIGIIGIALILSLSTGVNRYIEDIQRDTMASYPITVESQTIDLTSVILSAGRTAAEGEQGHEEEGVYSNVTGLKMASAVASSVTRNNLRDFKKFLDSDEEVQAHLGDNGIVYGYNLKYGVYARDPEGTFVNTDGSTLRTGGLSMGMGSGMMSGMGGSMSGSALFSELLPGRDGEVVNSALSDSYELIYGEWPAKFDEVVLIVDSNNEIQATALYKLGLLPTSEYKEAMQAIENGEEAKVEARRWDYDEICKHRLWLMPACDKYTDNGDGTFTYFGDSAAEIESRMEQGIPLRIVGILRATDDIKLAIGGTVGYTRTLTDYLIQYTEDSAVVRAQRAASGTNVLSGLAFAPDDDGARIADAKTYVEGLNISERAKMCREMLLTKGRSAETVGKTETDLSAMLDDLLADAKDETFLSIYDRYVSPGTLEDNLKAFGAVDYDDPYSISIYVDSFEDKDAIAACIDRYNEAAEELDRITYNDYVGLLMSSVKTIVNVISYVLIAFVAVSLVVSSIMIGIITYISVLERTKEIGILRAIGASKRNISQVFNAETFIVGLCAGAMGIAVSLLLLIPGNAVIHALTGNNNVNAILPWGGAIILVILSVILTLIGGLIPASKAAGMDPVAALRSE